MQKGKRYRFKTEQEFLDSGCVLVNDGDLWVPDDNYFGLGVRRYQEGANVEARDVTYFIRQPWAMVELPDDDLDTYIDRFVEAGWAEAVSGASQLKARCAHTNPDGSDAWVNYTPYHDASPMAKFACAKCDKERA